MPANSSNIQTQCPSRWSGAWRQRFHRTGYYTGFTTKHCIVYRSHNYTGLTTIQVSQGWLRSGEALLVLNATLRPALCAIGACSIVALVPSYEMEPEQFHRIPSLCSNTAPGLFVKSRDYWISCRAPQKREFWEMVQFNHQVLSNT